MTRLVQWLERLGGARALEVRTLPQSVALGLYWLSLLLLVLLFAGRATKFVYVDF